MSIVQTAETLDAYDRQINQMTGEAHKLQASVAGFAFVQIISTMAAVVFVPLTLLVFAQALYSGQGGLIVVALILGAIAFGVIRTAISSRQAAAKARVELAAVQEQLVDRSNMRRSIVDGVVAVTNKDFVATRISDSSTGTPVGGAGYVAEKVCPDCAEHIKGAAKKCRYCGYQFA